MKRFLTVLAAVLCSACTGVTINPISIDKAMQTHATDDSPLFEAVKKGDKAAVEVLLAKGADISAKNKDGWTPLHLAAYRDNKNIVEVLLDKGADVKAKDNDGWTPLHREADRNRNKAMVELLEEHSLK